MNFQRHRAACRRPQPVVDNRAGGRIRGRRFIRRQWRVGVHVPTHAHGGLWREQERRRIRQAGFNLPQRRHVVQYPKPASVRGGDQVVVLDDQIADRGRGRIQAHRLPPVAVIERNINLAFCSGIQQALALGIFTHHIDSRAFGNTVCDLRPRLAAVVRAKNVRVQIVQAKRVDRGIACLRVEMPRVQNRDFLPCHNAGRRDVFPVRPAIHRHMEQPVVRPGPNAVDVQGRRGHRIDDSALRGFGRWLIDILADRHRRGPGLASQIGADLLPVIAAIAGLPQGVSGEIQNTRIDGREQHGRGANGAKIPGVYRLRRHVLHLPCAPVIARELAAVHKIRIQRIGCNVAVFFGSHRMPIAEGDRAVVAAASDARRTTLLLPATNTIREGVVGGGMIHLRGGLVVPGAPGLPSVHGHDGALVAGK